MEIALLVVGIAAHWIKKLIESRQSGDKVGPIEAFKERPYHVLKVTLVALAGGIALFEMGQLNAISALLFGYFADSAPAALKRRLQK